MIDSASQIASLFFKSLHRWLSEFQFVLRILQLVWRLINHYLSCCVFNLSKGLDLVSGLSEFLMLLNLTYNLGLSHLLLIRLVLEQFFLNTTLSESQLTYNLQIIFRCLEVILPYRVFSLVRVFMLLKHYAAIRKAFIVLIRFLIYIIKQQFVRKISVIEASQFRRIVLL